jgi:hypothetical protein
VFIASQRNARARATPRESSGMPRLGIARNEYATARYQSTVYTVRPYTTCLEVGGTGWRPRHVCSLLCLAAALAMTMLEAHVPASSILAYALLSGCALAGYVSGSLHVSLCVPCCAPVRQLDRLSTEYFSSEPLDKTRLRCTFRTTSA